MYSKLFSVLVVSLLFLSAVNAKISDEEKSSIENGLQLFANDPEKLAVTIAVLNERYDLSDEPEFRQKIISAAQNAGISIDDYPNLKEGKAPVIDVVIDENLNVQETISPEVVEPSETITEPIVEESKEWNIGPALLIVAIVVVIAIGVVIFVLRKKK